MKNFDAEGQIGHLEYLVKTFAQTLEGFVPQRGDYGYHGDNKVLRVYVVPTGEKSKSDISINVQNLLKNIFNDQELFMYTEKQGEKLVMFFEPSTLS